MCVELERNEMFGGTNASEVTPILYIKTSPDHTQKQYICALHGI